LDLKLLESAVVALNIEWHYTPKHGSWLDLVAGSDVSRPPIPI